MVLQKTSELGICFTPCPKFVNFLVYPVSVFFLTNDVTIAYYYHYLSFYLNFIMSFNDILIKNRYNPRTKGSYLNILDEQVLRLVQICKFLFKFISLGCLLPLDIFTYIQTSFLLHYDKIQLINISRKIYVNKNCICKNL